MPSGETAVGAIIDTVEDAEETVAEGREVEEVTILPGEERYQFVAGSPRHSPTVTPR